MYVSLRTWWGNSAWPANISLVMVCCLTVSGCAGGARITDNEFINDLREIPIRPLIIRQTLPGDPVNTIDYYGIQFKQAF